MDTSLLYRGSFYVKICTIQAVYTGLNGKGVFLWGFFMIKIWSNCDLDWQVVLIYRDHQSLSPLHCELVSLIWTYFINSLFSNNLSYYWKTKVPQTDRHNMATWRDTKLKLRVKRNPVKLRHVIFCILHLVNDYILTCD